MPKVCGTPSEEFKVRIVPEAELPAAYDTPQVCGKDRMKQGKKSSLQRRRGIHSMEGSTPT